MTRNAGTYLHSDFRNYFTDAFEARVARNSAYSMRSFARDLGLAVSTLSELMKGKYGLSRDRSRQVGTKLGLTPIQIEHLSDLICREHSRSGSERSEAAARVKTRLQGMQPSFAIDAFQVISNWYHLAILEVLSLPGAEKDVKSISRKLGIPEKSAKEAVDRLLSLDLLVEGADGYSPTGDFTAVGSGLPSEAIRKFHRQILEKAMDALDSQSVDEREISSSVFSIRREELPKAKRDLQRFRRKFANRYSSPAEPVNDVFCLSVQLFSLLKGSSK